MSEGTPQPHAGAPRAWPLAGAVAVVCLLAGTAASLYSPARRPAAAAAPARPLAATRSAGARPARSLVPTLPPPAPRPARDFSAVARIVREAEAAHRARVVSLAVYDLRPSADDARLDATPGSSPLTFGVRPGRDHTPPIAIVFLLAVAAAFFFLRFLRKKGGFRGWQVPDSRASPTAPWGRAARRASA